MSQLSPELRLRVVSSLVHGNSINATFEMTGVARTTILRLLVKIAAACRRMHDALVRDLRCHYIEMDEQWSFIQLKEKRKTPAHGEELGDVFTFTALCRTTRLAVAYRVGKRTQAMTDAFVKDLRSRVLVAPVASMDGMGAYPGALRRNFEVIDAGQVIKQYGYSKSPDHKYEPARDAKFIKKQTVFGAPKHEELSTSLVERYHLTMRHTNGRKRRLCLAFSRKFTNHEAAVDLSVAAYNWTHVVATTGQTPAQAAGLTDHTFTLEELIDTALSIPEGEDKPVAKPLELREGTGPSRALPGGRGFLRLVGAAPAAPAAKHVAAPVAAPVTLAVVEPDLQLDLLAWAASRPAQSALDPWAEIEGLPASPEKSLPPQGTQLTLFDD